MEKQDSKQTEVLAAEFTVPFKPVRSGMATEAVVLPSPHCVPAHSLVSALGTVSPL